MRHAYRRQTNPANAKRQFSKGNSATVGSCCYKPQHAHRRCPAFHRLRRRATVTHERIIGKATWRRSAGEIATSNVPPRLRKISGYTAVGLTPATIGKLCGFKGNRRSSSGDVYNAMLKCLRQYYGDFTSASTQIGKT